jgi:hypothetical protein
MIWQESLLDLRDFSLGLNYIEILLFVEIFIYFYIGFRRVKQIGGTPDKFSLIAGVGFLFGALARGFYMQLDYYQMGYTYRDFAWIFLATGVGMVLYSLFRGTGRLVFRNLQHKVPYLIVGICLTTFMLVIRIWIGDLLAWIIVIIAGLAFLTPVIMHFLGWVNYVGGHIQRTFRFAAAGVPLLFVGIAMGPLWTYLPAFTGWIVNIIGHLTFMSGLGFLAIALMTLPTLAEFGWEEKIQHLLVLMEGGILVYEYDFTEKSVVDSDLVGSGLSGIVDLVKEMTGSKKGIKIIRQDQKDIYLEYGKKVTIVIIAEEELLILFEKIAQFTQEFEHLFANDIDSWDGNLKRFKDAESLVLKYFLPGEQDFAPLNKLRAKFNRK